MQNPDILLDVVLVCLTTQIAVHEAEYGKLCAAHYGDRERC
jgi:hypothetical protein